MGGAGQICQCKPRSWREENDATPPSKPYRTWPDPKPTRLARSSSPDRRRARATGCAALRRSAAGRIAGQRSHAARHIARDRRRRDGHRRQRQRRARPQAVRLQHRGERQATAHSQLPGVWHRDPGCGTCSAKAPAGGLYQQPVDAGQRPGQRLPHRRAALRSGLDLPLAAKHHSVPQ